MGGLLLRNLTRLKQSSLLGPLSAPNRLSVGVCAARTFSNGTTACARQQQQAVLNKKPGVVAISRKGSNRNTRSNSKGSMKLTIAIEGCCHGELDKIYATLQLLEQREGKKIDLLICCGDFQAVRNLDDLETMACPPKYRSMQTFYKYYSGEKVAPFPTVFIGGNHEAANHLWELYYGGWAAPNIFFLGFAGTVRFGGLRIAGLSGIYKQHDYLRGHHESLPYNESTIRSLYHIRDFEVYRLLQLQQPVDIFLSHDWPTNIARYGNTAQLLARKAFLRSEVESGTLGSPPAAQLLSELKPAFWFAAHLHTKFAALVQHHNNSGITTTTNNNNSNSNNNNNNSSRATPQQQQQQREGSGGGDAGRSSRGGNGFPTTRFLALDKCLPGREFLQVIEVDAPGPPELHYDEEWLAVLRTTHHHTNLAFKHAPLPGMGALRSGPRPEDVEFVRQVLAARGTSRVPDNFIATAEPYNPASGQRRGRMPQRHVRNPQTVTLLDMLGLPYNLDHGDVAGGKGPASASATAVIAAAAAAAAARGGVAGAPISLSWTARSAPPGLQQQQEAQAQAQQRPATIAGPPAPLPPNPEEIDLGDLDEDEVEEEEVKQQPQPQPQQQQQEQEQEQGTTQIASTVGGVGGPEQVSEEGATGEAAGGGEGTEMAGCGGEEGGQPTTAAPLASDPMFQPLDL